MKTSRRRSILIVICGLFCAGVLYFLGIPASSPWSAGLSLTARGTQTNATGQIVSLYAISNGSPHALYVKPAIELSRSSNAFFVSGAFDLTGPPHQLLQPREDLVFPFAAITPSRPVVHCQREIFSGHPLDRPKRWFNVCILKESESKIVYESSTTSGP